MTVPFRPVALEHASRLVNHGPTVLVTSADGARRNVMAAAWSMPVEFTPPRIAIVIDKRTFTRELVTASGAFGICLPGTALVDLTYAARQHERPHARQVRALRHRGESRARCWACR